MVYKELSSRNNLELRVYRLLGVNQFRKLILAIEKVRHFKDKQKNENYHLSSFDIFSLERYDGFLIYNAFLHCISLLFTLVYAVMTIIIGFRNAALDLCVIFLILLNIYCIILQRTNYLRLKKYRCKYYRHFQNRTDVCTEETIRRVYASQLREFQTDYKLLSRMRKTFEGKADCVITSADAESLKRLCACFEPAVTKGAERKDKEALKIGLIEQCNAVLRPYSMLQMRIDRLQKKFGVSGRKMLDRTVIITEDAECEMLYKKLIPQDTAYNFCLVYFRLYDAFTGIINKAGIAGINEA